MWNWGTIKPYCCKPTEISLCYLLIICQNSQNPQISVTTIACFVLELVPEPVITGPHRKWRCTSKSNRRKLVKVNRKQVAHNCVTSPSPTEAFRQKLLQPVWLCHLTFHWPYAADESVQNNTGNSATDWNHHLDVGILYVFVACCFAHLWLLTELICRWDF